MLPFAVYLVVMLLTLLGGISIVMSEIGGHSFTFQIALIWLVPLVTISGVILEAWYLLLVVAIVVSAIWLFTRSWRKFSAELTGKGTARDHSPLFDLCGLMFAIFFINSVIVLLMLAGGSDPTAPSEDAEDWELLFLLANASVWEELIVRVLLIGVPLLIIGLVRSRSDMNPLRYLVGGRIDIGWVEAVIILASAAVFGMAHYWGWGAWKVFPSGLAGVAFGYMYLRHGLAASIMLHFAFDYLSLPITIYDVSIGAQLVFGLATLAWLAAGSVFAIYYATRTFEFVLGRRLLEDPADSAVATGVGRPYGYGAYRAGATQTGAWSSGRGSVTSESEGAPPFTTGERWFACPVCGSAEARWLDGRLQCLGCGRLFQ